MTDERDPHDPAVDAAWREHAHDEPPRAVDDAIRAAAHRAVGSGPRKAAPVARLRWQTWAPLAIAATLGVIALGVVQLAPRDPDATREVVSDVVGAAPPAAPPSVPSPAPIGSRADSETRLGRTSRGASPAKPSALVAQGANSALTPSPVDAIPREPQAFPRMREQAKEQRSGATPEAPPRSPPRDVPVPFPASGGAAPAGAPPGGPALAPAPAPMPVPPPAVENEPSARRPALAAARSPAPAVDAATASEGKLEAQPRSIDAQSRSASADRGAGQSAATRDTTAAAPMRKDALADERSADARKAMAPRAPDDFFASIRRLRDEGREAEAIAMLAQYRAAFGNDDNRLPGDLRLWALRVSRP